MATSPHWKRWLWGLLIWAGAIFASTFVGDMLASDHLADCDAEWPGAIGFPPDTPEGQILSACHNHNEAEWWGFVVAMGLMTGVSTAAGIHRGRQLNRPADPSSE